MLPRPITFTLLCGLFTGQALADRVPGTGVTLEPPPGLTASDRFAGFLDRRTGASINVTEVPGPFDQVTAGLRDAERLATQGMRSLGQTELTISGQPALLIEASQRANDTEYRKWLLAVDRAGETTLIVATWPADEPAQGAALKAALLAAEVGGGGDPAAALNFSLRPLPPFKLAKVMGQTAVLSPAGQFPLRDKSSPLMVVGLSATDDAPVTDQRGFAAQRVRQTAGVEDIEPGDIKPITIAGLPGLVTIATGRDKDDATPMTIFQVTLFDDDGYVIAVGLTPTAERDRYLPIFEQIARSIAMKQGGG